MVNGNFVSGISGIWKSKKRPYKKFPEILSKGDVHQNDLKNSLR